MDDPQKQYKLLVLSDGTQVITSGSAGVSMLTMGIIDADGKEANVASEHVLDIDQEQHDELVKQAVTNSIDVDTITEKAQALMNTDTLIPQPNSNQEAN